MDVTRYLFFRPGLMLLMTILAAPLGMREVIGMEKSVAYDISVMPLFDGLRNDSLNTWGGAWRSGSMRVDIQSSHVHHERYALAAEMGPLAAGEEGYFQCMASGYGRTKEYHQTRNLARCEQMRFTISNDSDAAVACAVQLKDYRDSLSQRAVFHFSLPAHSDWSSISVPLSLSAPGWTVDGAPDLTQILTIDFKFAPQKAIKTGHIYLESIDLIERGGTIDIDTSPTAALMERLSHRQWDALWAARSRQHGMIANNSYQSTDAGLNCTAAVLWMLPAATRRHWVSDAEATEYVQILVHTIDKLLDRAHCVPPRNVDWVTLKPTLLPEESAVDAAFMAIALHQYKSLPSTPPALREAIDRTQNRFDFDAFGTPVGWRMSYRYATHFGPEGFVPATYDGYTNEGNVISLAAHLATKHHVPLETHWNTDTKRVRGEVQAFNKADSRKFDEVPVVHSFKEFRAPFTQALLNLFVDVRNRGIDRYPDDRLAVNPWQNFVLYETQVMARLAELRRPYLVQPDAGDDGSLRNYQQFSMYNDFGEGDLFMPWSAAFALMAKVDGSDDAMRYLLRHHLHDTLGMADSAKWVTGAAEPYAVTARHDFWNTALGTMALLEFLDGETGASKSFAALPEVQDGLDRVFVVTTKRLHDKELRTVDARATNSRAGDTHPVDARNLEVHQASFITGDVSKPGTPHEVVQVSAKSVALPLPAIAPKAMISAQAPVPAQATGAARHD